MIQMESKPLYSDAVWWMLKQPGSHRKFRVLVASIEGIVLFRSSKQH